MNNRPTNYKRKSFYIGSPDKLGAATELGHALQIDDLSQEIAIIRLRIKKAVLEMPDDSEFILRAMDTLAKLMKVQHAIKQGHNEETTKAIIDVLAGIGGAIWPDQFKEIGETKTDGS